MDRKRIFAIIKKDVSSIAQNAQMWLPMVVVPLVFIIIIPLVITLVGRNVNFSDINQSAQVEQYLLNIPLPELKNELAQFPELMQKGVYIFSNYIFAPMFLIVPVMVSAIISANSFAGEKEKKTLESLLYTPVSEKELFFSKTAAAFLPAIAIAAAGFVLYGAV